MNFSAIHISDIHFREEPSSSRDFREEIKKKIREDKLGADCLIVSGDLFNRGVLDESQFSDYKSYLNQLPGCDFKLFVPGNHDLDRSAQLAKKDSFNVYNTRRKLVLDIGDELVKEAGKEFSINDANPVILYKQAFDAFFTFSRKMESKSYCQENPPLSPDCYEVQVVDYHVGDESMPTIRFVLLNTALIAGQAVRGKAYRDRVDKYNCEYQGAVADGDSVKAAEVAVNKAKLQKRYEDDGEYIVDEEQSKGSGRLSLSKEGNRLLSNLDRNNAALTIFVGHHGFQFLSSETQNAMKKAMRNCGSGLYLCGHAHQAGFARFQIHPNSLPRDVEQIRAGVSFQGKMGVVQFGFNHISFTLENGSIDGVIRSYFQVESASGEPRWLHEDIRYHFDYPDSISSTPKDGNVSSKGSIENKVSDDAISPRGNETSLSDNNPKTVSKNGPATTHIFGF